MDKDFIESKIECMEQYLHDLEPLLKKETMAIVQDELVRSTVERKTQLLVDAAIDINTHLITSLNFRTPDDYYNTFIILGERQILGDEFARKIANSVRFRNQIVHNYERMSRTEMIEKIKENISDYKMYIKAILDYLDK